MAGGRFSSFRNNAALSPLNLWPTVLPKRDNSAGDKFPAYRLRTPAAQEVEDDGDQGKEEQQVN